MALKDIQHHECTRWNFQFDFIYSKLVQQNNTTCPQLGTQNTSNSSKRNSEPYTHLELIKSVDKV